MGDEAREVSGSSSDEGSEISHQIRELFEEEVRRYSPDISSSFCCEGVGNVIHDIRRGRYRLGCLPEKRGSLERQFVESLG